MMEPPIIFTVPKGFDVPHIAMIQRQAMQSWEELMPKGIVLCGNDPGVELYARDRQYEHIPDVLCYEGIPRVDSVFKRVQQMFPDDVLLYANADIVLVPEILLALKAVKRKFDNYLMVGQRWNWNIPVAMIGDDDKWVDRLVEVAITQGELNPSVCIDYFGFKSGLYGEFPPMAIGCYAWDPELLCRARDSGAAIVDVSGVATVIHQDHRIFRRSRIGALARRNQGMRSEDTKTFFATDQTEWLMEFVEDEYPAVKIRKRDAASHN